MIEHTPPGSPTGWLAAALAGVTTAAPTISTHGRHSTPYEEGIVEFPTAGKGHQFAARLPSKPADNRARPTPPVPTRPRPNSVMALLLKDAFRQFYGDGWEDAY